MSQINKLRIVAVIIVMVLVGLYFANSQNENGATVDAGVENAETTEAQAAPVSDAGLWEMIIRWARL